MKNRPYKILGDKPTLRNIREWRGLSQKELAEKAKISDSVLGYYELGKTIPTLDKAIALARALNIPVKVLAESLGINTAGIPDEMEKEKI